MKPACMAFQSKSWGPECRPDVVPTVKLGASRNLMMSLEEAGSKRDFQLRHPRQKGGLHTVKRVGARL